jgi:hypothetical protein
LNLIVAKVVIQPRPVAIKKAAERGLALSPDASPLNPPIKSATFQRFLPDIHFILASRSTDGLTFFLSLDVPGPEKCSSDSRPQRRTALGIGVSMGNFSGALRFPSQCRCPLARHCGHFLGSGVKPRRVPKRGSIL